MTDTIDHDSRDFALEAAVLEGHHKEAGTNACPPSQLDPFPVKLHWMLQQTEKSGLSHVVSWAPHGRAFIVNNRDEFVRVVLPAYFKQTKLSSFQRQLALYGFRRLTTGPDRGGYYQPYFLQISMVFSRNIYRTKVKNEGPRKKSSPDREPDFYKMPKLSDAAQKAEFRSNFPNLIGESQQHPPMSRLAPPEHNSVGSISAMVLQSISRRGAPIRSRGDTDVYQSKLPLQVPRTTIPITECVSSPRSSSRADALMLHNRLPTHQLLLQQERFDVGRNTAKLLPSTELNWNGIRLSSGLAASPIIPPSTRSRGEAITELILVRSRRLDLVNHRSLNAAVSQLTENTRQEDYVMSLLRGSMR